MKWILAIVVLALVALGAWVRLRPVPEARLAARPGPDEAGWHAMEGGVKLVLPGAPDGAEAALREAALRTPRTVEVTPGTYVTRSALWGFPDVTRVWRDGDRLHVHAHLVIGKGDLGVNRKRLERWLAEAGLETGAN